MGEPGSVEKEGGVDSDKVKTGGKCRVMKMKMEAGGNCTSKHQEKCEKYLY